MVINLHHVGVVVKSIAGMGEDFARSVSADWNGEIIHDPQQGARVSFFVPRAPGQPVFELVEPTGPESPVELFLRRGGGLHHPCYEIPLLDERLEWHRTQRDLVLRNPVPAVAFEGRRIAWVYTRHRLLLEYLER